MQHVMTWHEGSELSTGHGWRRKGLLAILLFEALGAFIGGPALVAAPDGRFMQIPVEELQGAFPDFLIPGLLLTFLGALNFVAFYALLRRRQSAWLWVGLAMGGFLVWFVVEVAIMGVKSWAQVAWGLPVPIGLVLALPLLFERLGRRKA